DRSSQAGTPTFRPQSGSPREVRRPPRRRESVRRTAKRPTSILLEAGSNQKTGWTAETGGSQPSSMNYLALLIGIAKCSSRQRAGAHEDAAHAGDEQARREVTRAEGFASQ